MQISEELFVALLKYHLVEIDDVLPEIKKDLEEKWEVMVRRDLYTKYKTADMCIIICVRSVMLRIFKF